MQATQQYPILKVDESRDDMKESEVLEYYNESYQQAYSSWGEFITEADRDMAFYLGDQWDAADKHALSMQKRSALVFNKIKRIIKMVEGYERKTRVSLMASPTGDEDQPLTDQLTKCLIRQMNIARLHMTMSEAFSGSLKTGINLVQLSLDHSEDLLSGEIMGSRLAHNQFLLDPRMERRDLKDCEYIIQRKYMSKNSVKVLLPFRSDEIDLMKGGNYDDKFPYMPPARDWKKRDLLRFDEFWVRKTRPIKVLLDKESGMMKKWDGNEEVLRQIMIMDPLERLALGLPAMPTIMKREEKYVELNVIVENELMYSGPDPWGLNDFPHIPVMCFWDPEYAAISSESDFSLKLQGMVRSMRDPQTEVNKRRSKALDMMDSSLQGGWQARENSVVNPKALYQSGNSGVVWMKEDAQMTDAQKLQPSDIPPSLIHLSELFDRDLMEISGATSELMGMPENENMPISGILAKVRQGAGLTILQDIFDNFRFSQEMLGEKLLKMMQINYHPSKIQRILNEKPHPQFKDVDAIKYDLKVEETVETPSQKNLFFMQLMQAKQVGIPIPDSLLLENMPIQNKEKIIEALKGQEQQMARQQQIEDQQRQTLNELSQAKIMSDVGMGIERVARAEADTALARERISESQQNQAQAILNRAEAIVKISQMKDDQLLKWAEFIRQSELDHFTRQEKAIVGDQKKVAGDVAMGMQMLAQRSKVVK